MEGTGSISSVYQCVPCCVVKMNLEKKDKRLLLESIIKNTLRSRIRDKKLELLTFQIVVQNIKCKDDNANSGKQNKNHSAIHLIIYKDKNSIFFYYY